MTESIEWTPLPEGSDITSTLGLMSHELAHDMIPSPAERQHGSLQMLASMARLFGDSVPRHVAARIAALQEGFDAKGALSEEEEHERHALSMYFWDGMLSLQHGGLPDSIAGDTHFCETCRRDRLKYNLPPVALQADRHHIRQTRLIELLQSGTSELPTDLLPVSGAEIAAAAARACFAAGDPGTMAAISECARKMLAPGAAGS